MVAKTFPRALKLTGFAEGGWADRPLADDPGGPTMKGVTLGTYRGYRQRKGRPAPLKEDLRRITDAEVEEIFKSGYWDQAKCDGLPAGLDYAVFDFAINSGAARAVRVLQELCGTPADGRWGPKSAAALAVRMEAWPMATIIDRYQDMRLAWLKGRANFDANPGWITRVAHVRRDAKAIAAET